MLQQTTRRLLPAFTRRSATPAFRTYTTSHSTDNPVPANDPNPKQPHTPVSTTNQRPVSNTGSQDKPLQESFEDGERKRVMQASNREAIWSRSQKPRSEAMVGPRFEQTIMEDQPRPQAAIELIHKQPVRWTNKRTVSCDGGGGPLGHPRIFINVDKPQICWCTYCGVPFAHEHHREYLKTLPNPSYPLESTGDPAEIPPPDVTGKTGSTEPYQTATGAPLEQR